MRNRWKLVAAATLAALAGVSHAQVVIGLANSTEQIRVYAIGAVNGFSDFSPAGFAVTAMSADDTNRIIWYSSGSQLFRVSYDASRTPVLIGSFSGAATSLVGGLAWVPGENKLYGSNTTELFEVDTNTAALTLIRNITDADFGGLDFNTSDGKIYAANDSTSTNAPLAGRGIYTISPPFATGAITRIAAYPIGQTDIDGLAVGDGLVFLCRDINANKTYVYNLASGQYGFEFSRPGGTATSRTSCGAAWAPNLNIAPPGVNLGIAIVDPADCTVGVNATANYSLAITNAGADPATNVSVEITLPAGATSVTSSPVGSLSGNILTIALGGVAGSNGTTSVTLSFTATLGPTIDLSAVVSSPEPDTSLSNNTASASSFLTPPMPATAAIKGVISDLASSPSSDVPGLAGVKFISPIGLSANVPVFSQNGRNWIMLWETNALYTESRVIITSINGTRSVAVREGITMLPSGFTPTETFTTFYDINNAGQFVFAGIDASGLTAFDGYITKWNGTSFVTVAQEGSPAHPSTGGLLWGAMHGSAQIAEDGTVAFFQSVTGLNSATDGFLLRNDGATVVAQKGVTSPTNQLGVPGTYQFIEVASPGIGTFFSADHSSFIMTGDTSAASTEDKFVVVNNDVKIQEGHIIAGSAFTSPVSVVDAVSITHSGAHWYAHGRNDDAIDWVVRDSAVVAQTGAPIFPGSTELFDGAHVQVTFFVAAGNDNGDYVVGGATNTANAAANTVLVLNNTAVIARENDPIDLDDNGVFDEGVYINTFMNDRIAVTNDAVFVVVSMRDHLAATCGAPATNIGLALIRVPIASTPATGRCCIGARCAVVAPASCTAAGAAGVVFSSGASDCNATGTFNAPCCCADYNKVGGVGVQDIFDFLSDWFAGSPNANVQGDGVAGPGVQDIFDFLSAWFAGC